MQNEILTNYRELISERNLMRLKPTDKKVFEPSYNKKPSSVKHLTKEGKMKMLSEQIFETLRKHDSLDSMGVAVIISAKPGSVSSLLSAMYKAGIVDRKKKGRIFHYSLRADYKNQPLTTLVKTLRDFRNETMKEFRDSKKEEKETSKEEKTFKIVKDQVELHLHLGKVRKVVFHFE